MLKLKSICKFFVSIALAATFIAGCTGTKTTESTGQFVDDSVITTKIKSAILGEASLKSLQINVKTFKGVVQLSGFVDSSKIASTAEDIAYTVDGVKSVKNDLVVK
ncbi:MAG: transporter [Bdellovibrionales bacterium RIFOXYB1_FULL_37_110]|nr:MAG: transporter [Bdellovibrionales bacterium RIFOXYC1_FULL_37_79]OFZ57339.1 MAG: transporter [Bdellovibrionales bacterium RIFOXYB1_FULL_37_110]OFZ62235.1 MAG: transporter [Bdellovibrionales bacterium RIFOXYD1_FULL_36_51]